MDDKGNLLNKDDYEYRNPYEKFLSCINPYQRNGKSDPDDHDIFLMTQKEFGDCIDALRDGDYVFVIEQYGGYCVMMKEEFEKFISESVEI